MVFSFLLSELDRRKESLKTQLVWIGVQKEPGIAASTWKWVNSKFYYSLLFYKSCSYNKYYSLFL